MLTAAILILPAMHAFAQRLRADEDGPKGQFMLYGSLDYSKTNAPGNHTSSFSTSPGAGIPLGLGYFINNNDLIGVNYAFSSQKQSATGYSMKQNEAGIWYSPSVMIGKYFLLIAQVDAHYVWGSQEIEAPGVPAREKFTGYRLRAYPMLGVLLGKGWALKFKFGELSNLMTKPSNGASTNNFVAGLSGATFGTGISKNFNFKKKH
ncbi:Outer membrane protein beta-barrel domain-containing protein [Dyadobacter soli]|uniref:Outer membrane protein beta-barrel domain-containing protein n=2 Tax=Dyadobacter soli TaxID=659014 RepID=A0A1G7Q3Q8_9BACT|nr:Outer membrane protein beta-barrel domain-containing protein [Dyadobacter soli]